MKASRAVLVVMLLVLLPSGAHAGGALFMKGGSVVVSRSHQNLDGNQQEFDAAGNGAFAVSYETRKKHGLSFGVEYLSYRNSFTTTAGSEGKANASAAMFVFKKYFERGDNLNLYLGLGVGGGPREYSYQIGSVQYTDYASGLAGQIVGGLEIRTEGNFAFLFEIKGISFDTSSSFGANDYNPSGIGAFFGIGGYW